MWMEAWCPLNGKLNRHFILFGLSVFVSLHKYLLNICLFVRQSLVFCKASALVKTAGNKCLKTTSIYLSWSLWVRSSEIHS